jgi:hypothetical protein
MAKRSRRDPFELTLSADAQATLIDLLARELQYAIMARMRIVGDDGTLDAAHQKYLGGDASLVVDTPWPDAANLGSWIVTEAVDAMRARIMATIFTDPIWIVEGFGADAVKAPVVEEFHQWKADQTKLQQFMGRAVHNALIEGTGVLEVSDQVVLIKARKRIKVRLTQDPATGQVTLGPDGHPIVMRSGEKFTEATDPNQPFVEMIVNDVGRTTAGPAYRVLSLKDFYVLPGHAAERSDVWGYAKRCWRRLAELQGRERDGYYTNIAALGGPASSERLAPTGGVGDTMSQLERGQDIAPQQDVASAEKEIWELTLLLDLDEDGFDEWYVITFSALHRQLLRVQYDNYDTPSYVLLTPFPRPDSIYGFSFAQDKLGSLYDEHTALRNMYMDRTALKTNAPLLQVEGSPWNPADRPFGPAEVIPVRDLNEIKQLEVADVPNSLVHAMQEIVAAKERLSGMNDTTTGQLADANRTLGEVKLVTQQSWIRIDEVVKNLQQGFEDLFDLLNLIWKNKLRAAPEPWPGDLQMTLQARAINLGTQITADVLEGAFRGKPRGSVEASDFSQMRADFVQLVTAITQLSQTVPALKLQLNNPMAVRSILTQMVRVYRWPDRQSLVGNFTGQGPQALPLKPPDPPKIGIQIKADASTDPLAQQVLSRAATAEGVGGNGNVPIPPVGVPGVPNVASAAG